MIHIGAWIWSEPGKPPKYGPEYIDRLRRGVERHLTLPYRFHVWRPLEIDAHLTAGCLCRLRTLSIAWQKTHDIGAGDRIVCLDLDMVVTGSLDALFERDEPFTILQGVNAVNPCRYNGSVWALKAGYRPDVWEDFSPAAAKAVPHFTVPDDQSYLAHMLPGAGAFGPDCGVYGFQKPGWPKGDALPSNAKLVAFFGARDPAQFTHLDWVRRHWLGVGGQSPTPFQF